MLDSIREIFDILGISLESIEFKVDEYEDFEELNRAIKAKKCPVVSVSNGEHVMVATGINPGTREIQVKDSYRDDPRIPGKIR